MKLLVSVRSVEEALAALDGGADLIDVKEPENGPLGKATDEVIAEIVQYVAGRRPVSAAMGELLDDVKSDLRSISLAVRKWGLAGCAEEPWHEPLLELREATSAIVVPVAYADAESAESPSVADVANFAGSNGFPIILIDTWEKEGFDLLSWMTPGELRRLVDEMRAKGTAVALAGSLKREHALILQRIEPDWVAVRGAVCDGGKRSEKVVAEKVRALRMALAGN